MSVSTGVIGRNDRCKHRNDDQGDNDQQPQNCQPVFRECQKPQIGSTGPGLESGGPVYLPEAIPSCGLFLMLYLSSSKYHWEN